jgi:hypothetical protein
MDLNQRSLGYELSHTRVNTESYRVRRGTDVPCAAPCATSVQPPLTCLRDLARVGERSTVLPTLAPHSTLVRPP